MAVARPQNSGRRAGEVTGNAFGAFSKQLTPNRGLYFDASGKEPRKLRTALSYIETIRRVWVEAEGLDPESAG